MRFVTYRFNACPVVVAVTLATGILLAGPAFATEYFVDSSRPDDSGNGLSWATAEKTIAAGVADATAGGDIVTISNGTYNVGTEISITTPITVRSYRGGVYGGLANARNTIVDGGGVTRVFDIDVENTGTVRLDGLTIQNGYGTGSNNDGGGGVCLDDVYGVFSNCVIRSNTQTSRGGAGVYGVYVDAVFHMCWSLLVCVLYVPADRSDLWSQPLIPDITMPLAKYLCKKT